MGGREPARSVRIESVCNNGRHRNVRVICYAAVTVMDVMKIDNAVYCYFGSVTYFSVTWRSLLGIFFPKKCFLVLLFPQKSSVNTVVNPPSWIFRFCVKRGADPR